MELADLAAIVPPHIEPKKRLGEGSFASVWEAVDVRLGGKRVALKVGEHCLDPAAFAHEAKIVGHLDGLNVPAVHESGVLADGTPYLLMELFDAPNLDELIAIEPLPLSEALEYAEQLFSALATIHARGYIHRDVKPANILVAEGEGHCTRIVLLDYGIATTFADAVRELDDRGEVMGTPAYMTPEQIRGEPLDARCDLYAAGAVLFEMLTGRPPFTGESAMAVVHRVLSEKCPRPSELRADIPRELDDLVARLLATDRSHRPANAEKAREHLHRLRRMLDRGDTPPAIRDSEQVDGTERASDRVSGSVSGVLRAGTSPIAVATAIEEPRHGTQPIPLVRHRSVRPLGTLIVESGPPAALAS